MYPTFRFFIPVRSLSLFSRPAIQLCASFIEFLSSSSSAEYPSFIIPPSFTVYGGSSTILFSISSYTSPRSCISSFSLESSISSRDARSSFTAGIARQEFLSAIRSLPLALPHDTRPTSLSKSYTSFRCSLILFLVRIFSVRHSTASSLIRISPTLLSGSFIHCLSFRDPIAV